MARCCTDSVSCRVVLGWLLVMKILVEGRVCEERRKVEMGGGVRVYICCEAGAGSRGLSIVACRSGRGCVGAGAMGTETLSH
jgi:hypothetical protein